MSSFAQTEKTKNTPPQNLWFEKLMAVIALINLGLVLFDFSYIPWRNFWLLHTIKVDEKTIEIPLPNITDWYDPIKGIEPHRETQNYLDTVAKLEKEVQTTGINSPITETLLIELQQLSVEMIAINPFASANKTGTLEKIKDNIRIHIYAPSGKYNKSVIREKSAKKAFQTFWSQSYLTTQDWQTEINWYHQQIQPLMQTNYYRQVGENGELIDYFWWKIDKWFLIIFTLELAARTFYLSRKYKNKNTSWVEIFLWRWYDLFLLLPMYAWLRVIPVTIRLDQANLLDLALIKKQINMSFVATFAEELTQIVVIRVINQMQNSIRYGDITRWLSGGQVRPYIDINNTNEVEAIAKLVINLTIEKILPKIATDLEGIIQYNIEKTLNQFPPYQVIQQIPGLGHLPKELTAKLVEDLWQSSYKMLTDSLKEDPVGAEKINHLIKNLTEAVTSEVQRNQTLDKIQNLLVDMLEEIKLNYVHRLSDEDFEQILQQTQQIRNIEPPLTKSIQKYD